MRKSHSLHKKLLLRLLLVGLAVSFILGLAVIARTWNIVDETVLDQAIYGVEFFNYFASPFLEGESISDSSGLQKALEEFPESYHRRDLGKFVYIRIYDRKRKNIAGISENDHPEYSLIKTFIKNSSQWFPNKEKKRYEILRFNGKPHIKVAVPLLSSRKKVIAYIEGIFAVSEKAMFFVRIGGVRTAVGVVAVILLTTVLIYPVILSLLKSLALLSVNLLDSHLEMLNVLGSAIAKRDSDTDAHNFRVTIISVCLAEAIDLKADSIRKLIKGAFLHDVGKIGIPDNVLLKPARLSPDEFTVMKTHVDKGMDIVKRSSWLNDALEVVGGHHEKVDGTGYPAGIDGVKTPVTARIFAIVDVFDALTSKRPYKAAMSYEETIGILQKGRGTHFDSEILDKFLQISGPLYDEYSGREDEKLKEQLHSIVERYFSMDIADFI